MENGAITTLGKGRQSLNREDPEWNDKVENRVSMDHVECFSARPLPWAARYKTAGTGSYMFILPAQDCRMRAAHTSTFSSTMKKIPQVLQLAFFKEMSVLTDPGRCAYHQPRLWKRWLKI
jgi:hypothetical protein